MIANKKYNFTLERPVWECHTARLNVLADSASEALHLGHDEGAWIDATIDEGVSDSYFGDTICVISKKPIQYEQRTT